MTKNEAESIVQSCTSLRNHKDAHIRDRQLGEAVATLIDKHGETLSRLAEKFAVPAKALQSAHSIWTKVPKPIQRLYYEDAKMSQGQMLYIAQVQENPEDQWKLAIAIIHETEHGRELSGHSGGKLTRTVQLMKKRGISAMEALAEFGIRFRDRDALTISLQGAEKVLTLQKAAILEGKSLNDYYMHAMLEHAKTVIANAEGTADLQQEQKGKPPMTEQNPEHPLTIPAIEIVRELIREIPELDDDDEDYDPEDSDWTLEVDQDGRRTFTTRRFGMKLVLTGEEHPRDQGKTEDFDEDCVSARIAFYREDPVLLDALEDQDQSLGAAHLYNLVRDYHTEG